MREKLREALIVLSMVLGTATPATAQVSVGVAIGTPNVSIGINVPVYPALVAVPSYPVYYAPRLRANYFFYDGMYWVYDGGHWHTSVWYNGPWAVVSPYAVPAYVLRVPVRYYRAPPAYFAGWRVDAAPRWGAHWGREWEVRRAGWDRWDRRAVPARAPLPLYQRAYAGDRYPRVVEQQYAIRIQNYRYQPRETTVRAHYKEQVAKAPAPQKKQSATERQVDKALRSPAPAAGGPAPAKKEPAAKSGKDSKKEEGAKSAKEFAPGQVKREEGAKSAKEFAPGQVKREEGAKSAKEFAPGQQAREQRGNDKAGDGKGKGGGKDDDRRRDK